MSVRVSSSASVRIRALSSLFDPAREHTIEVYEWDPAATVSLVTWWVLSTRVTFSFNRNCSSSLSVAALSFLGLGFPTGYAEWGQLVDFARAWLQPQFWWVMVYPAAFIILFSLGFNLFGDALRDAYDPKSR